MQTPGVNVSADIPGKTLWLSPVETRVVPVVEPAASLRALGASPALTAALAGDTPMPADASVAVSWVWMIPKDSRTTVVNDPRPALMGLFAQADGLSTDDIVPVLVRLVPAGPAWSIVTLARGPAGAPTRELNDWDVSKALTQDVVKVDAKMSGPGLVEIRPSAPLAPGEYAFVLRPSFGKRYAGERVFAQDGDGLAFRVAWKITIR